MTTAAFFLGVLATWLLIGVVLAVVMGRRGYSAFSWGVLGAVLGPLAVPLAVSAARGKPSDFPKTVVTSDRIDGGVDVLIGIDGSVQSEAALTRVVAMMSNCLGRVVLAWVLDFDTAVANMRRGEKERAERALKEQAARLGAMGVPAEGVLLAGRPASALVEYATSNGFSLVVIGTRGSGASRRVFGSVATELAQHTRVPVMMVAPCDDNALTPAGASV
jgi:nucleotide-binding universal stress UspA family protein